MHVMSSIGLVALLIALVGFIPRLGWLNGFVVLALAIIRLALGGAAFCRRWPAMPHEAL
jgi:hypothetical protein